MPEGAGSAAPSPMPTLRRLPETLVNQIAANAQRTEAIAPAVAAVLADMRSAMDE